MSLKNLKNSNGTSIWLRSSNGWVWMGESNRMMRNSVIQVVNQIMVNRAKESCMQSNQGCWISLTCLYYWFEWWIEHLHCNSENCDFALVIPKRVVFEWQTWSKCWQQKSSCDGWWRKDVAQRIWHIPEIEKPQFIWFLCPNPARTPRQLRYSAKTLTWHSNCSPPKYHFHLPRQQTKGKSWIVPPTVILIQNRST